MSHHRLGQVSVQFELIRVREVDGATPAGCLRCSGGLELNQPDPEEPDRLIGMCFDCETWFLIDRSPSESVVEMIELPSRASPRGMLLVTIWPDPIDRSPSIQAGA